MRLGVLLVMTETRLTLLYFCLASKHWTIASCRPITTLITFTRNKITLQYYYQFIETLSYFNKSCVPHFPNTPALHSHIKLSICFYCTRTPHTLRLINTLTRRHLNYSVPTATLLHNSSHHFQNCDTSPIFLKTPTLVTRNSAARLDEFVIVL